MEYQSVWEARRFMINVSDLLLLACAGRTQEDMGLGSPKICWKPFITAACKFFLHLHVIINK